MANIKIKMLRAKEAFLIPSRHVESEDAGFDIHTSRYIQIWPHQTVDIATNFAIELPKGMFGLIVPRSSTLKTRGLHVSVSVIDSGYRGEVMVMARNVSENIVSVEVGSRLAQMLVLPIPDMKFVRVEELSTSLRGDRGFGASGQ